MKNKGIAIELTALLDVILIMLFWVMMSMEWETDKVKADAAEAVAEQQAEFDRKAEELQYELDSVREDYNRFLDENAENAAVANQKALDEFAEGRMITLNLSYNAVGTLYISDESGELSHISIRSVNNIAAEIRSALDISGLGTNDVILCALVYDGDRALWRDVKMVSDAVGAVGKNYSNFYCTYINLSI